MLVNEQDKNYYSQHRLIRTCKVQQDIYRKVKMYVSWDLRFGKEIYIGKDSMSQSLV